MGAKLESLESLAARLKAEAQAHGTVGDDGGGGGGGARDSAGGGGGGALSGSGVQRGVAAIGGGVIIGRAGGPGAMDVGDDGAAETKIVHQFEAVSGEQQMRLQQIESTKQQQDGIIGEWERGRALARVRPLAFRAYTPPLPLPSLHVHLPPSSNPSAGEIGDLVDGLHDRAERMNDEVTVQSAMIQNLEGHIDLVQDKLHGVAGSLDETLKTIRGGDHSESASNCASTLRGAGRYSTPPSDSATPSTPLLVVLRMRPHASFYFAQPTDGNASTILF